MTSTHSEPVTRPALTEDDVLAALAGDGEVWLADVPDLPYCAAHGASPHEAVEEVEHAVDAWL